MRIAVISDIHGNLEAFLEVLSDIEKVKPDKVVSLGDNVGYGPDPEEVSRLIRERNIPSVMGNHELAIVDPSLLGWFNPLARQSILLTRDLISRETLDCLHRQPPAMVLADGLFVHGCPPDSATRYLSEVPIAGLKSLFGDMHQDMCFVGHTHELVLISLTGPTLTRCLLAQGTLRLAQGQRCIVNIGSVGQPRDGNNNAKYAVWDTDAHTLEIRYVPYDIARTVSKIHKLGFPEINATRLW